MALGTSAVEHMNIEKIVTKARREHTSKVSQFRAIRKNIEQYSPDTVDSAKMAAALMKELNPNERSGKGTEITVNSIVEKATTEHSRKLKSWFEAIQDGRGLILIGGFFFIRLLLSHVCKI